MSWKVLFSLLLTWNSVLCNTYYGNPHNQSAQFQYGVTRRDEWKDYMEPKVVGGVAVPISMNPHVATVTYKMGLHCGSSIITNRVTVTAAHCLIIKYPKEKVPASSLAIFVGSSIMRVGKEHQVCRTYPHPKYILAISRYDLELIMVKKPFIFGPTVQKIPLVQNERWKNKKYSFTVAGFGAISTEGNITGNRLVLSRMHYVDMNVCRRVKTYVKPVTLNRDVFCSLGIRWISDCVGDTGSGIVWKKYIVGIVSAGLDTSCGSDVIPSIYTNIFYFLKWIKDEVKNLQSSKQCTQ